MLDATEDDRRGQELEAEGGEPPPVEGDVQVEAGVVVADGGHHGDLEVHLQDEGGNKDAASAQKTEHYSVRVS